MSNQLSLSFIMCLFPLFECPAQAHVQAVKTSFIPQLCWPKYCINHIITPQSDKHLCLESIFNGKSEEMRDTTSWHFACHHAVGNQVQLCSVHSRWGAVCVYCLAILSYWTWQANTLALSINSSYTIITFNNMAHNLISNFI